VNGLGIDIHLLTNVVAFSSVQKRRNQTGWATRVFEATMNASAEKYTRYLLGIENIVRILELAQSERIVGTSAWTKHEALRETLLRYGCGKLGSISEHSQEESRSDSRLLL
jgi:hypothetical protein